MIDDDELILYVYNDGLSEQRRRQIARALRNDADLALRLAALGEELRALQPAEADPPLDPAMAQRWRTALAREARLQPATSTQGWRWLRWPGLGAVAAAGVLVYFGIGLGHWLDGRPDVQPNLGPMAVHHPSSNPAPLLRGVQLHLRDTQSLLPQLAVDDPDQRRSLLAETRAQNRLYAQAAEAQNDQQLARVLRAFDRALASLAADRADQQALAADRAQLAFELSAMQTKLAAATSKPAQSL